jgi:hypothetical protein
VPKLPPAFRTIPDGRDLLEAFEEVFPPNEGWILASGEVDSVELKLVSNGADQRRTLKGRFSLVQLSGPRGGPFGVTLSRLEGERIEMLGGTLTRARSAGVNAVCLGVSGELAVAGAPGRVPLPPAAEPPAAVTAGPVVAAPPGGGWAAQAGAAALAAAAPAEEEPEIDAGEPERGDLIQHFAFGICEVLNSSGDRLMIRDISGPGRIREIRSDMLVIHPPTEHNGKRLFKLSRRG